MPCGPPIRTDLPAHRLTQAVHLTARRGGDSFPHWERLRPAQTLPAPALSWFPSYYIYEQGRPVSPSYTWSEQDKTIRFHDLRHTFATLALQNGVDVKTVSSMLGHYDAGFTLRTYTHATRQMQQKAAEKMGSFMAQIR